MTVQRDQWQQRLRRVIEQHLADPNLNNQMLAASLGLSERQLFRKTERATGHSPKQLIRELRLQRAAFLLRKGHYRTVKEVAHAVGYQNVSYFIRRFEGRFDCRPLEILVREGWR